MPYTNSVQSLDRLAKQIGKVARGLEHEVPGLSKAHMDEAIANSNAARSHYLRLCNLRANIPSPWRGREALSYVVLFLWSWGSPWLTKFYQALANHAADVIQSGEYPVRNERFRIAWSNLRPYYSPRLFDYLEDECEVSIAFEEFSYMYSVSYTHLDVYKRQEPAVRVAEILPFFGLSCGKMCIRDSAKV